MQGPRFRPGLLAALLSLAACAAAPERRAPGGVAEWWGEPPVPPADLGAFPDGVGPLPEGSSRLLREHFPRHARLPAPGGGDVLLLGGKGVPDAVLARLRGVLQAVLCDAPGSPLGEGKAALLDAMAARRATLAVFATRSEAERAFARGLGELPLFLHEVQADGVALSAAERDPAQRDPALEVALRLVLGAGVHWARPDVEDEIHAAAVAAVRAGTFRTRPQLVLERATGVEYLVAAADVYCGLWAADPRGDGKSFGGAYAFCTREAQLAGDPRGAALVRAFLSDSLDLSGAGAPPPLTGRPAPAGPPPFDVDVDAHAQGVARDLLALFDGDGDGALAAGEVPPDFVELVGSADIDRDGRSDGDELALAAGLAVLGPAYVTLDPEREVERVFARLDLDGNGRIERGELPADLVEGFDAVDGNGDGAVEPSELLRSFAP